MAEDDFPHHRKPDAASLFCTVSGIIHPVKTVKYLFQAFFRNPRTIILKYQFQIVSLQCPFQGNHHSRIFFSPVSHRIGKQIIKNAFKFFPVQPDQKAAFSAEIFSLHLLVFHIRAHKFQILFHIISEIRFFHMIPETSIQPAVFGKAVHKADQIPGPCLYGLQIPESLFRCIRNALQKPVQIPHNSGQRCPQVMRDSGDQIPPAFFILQPLLYGFLQIGAHLIKIPAYLAKLILFLILHGRIQISLPNLLCAKAQFSKGL